jgi:hypothetical protein
VSAAVRVDPQQRCRLGHLTSEEVVPELRHERVARSVDDHVVDRVRPKLTQVGVLGQRAVVAAAQDPPVVHRHDEHAPVRQPTETRRCGIEPRQHIDRAVSRDAQHLVRMHVGHI